MTWHGRRRVAGAMVLAGLLAGVSGIPAEAAGVAGTGTRIAAERFVDVGPTDPFRTEILWLADQGISTGWPDGTFRPLLPVARDAIAAFLYRAAGRPAWSPPAVSPFRDVPVGSQFYAEITWLAANGISTGWPDGTFRPLNTVQRDAMAAFLYRLAGKPRWTPPAVSPFRDVATGSQFYPEITWLAARGISTGWPDGTFRPLLPVARNAMAAFLYRFVHLPALFDVTRVSVATNGAAGDDWSYSPALSADGRYVAFWSAAATLVAGDTNRVEDVFRRDLQTGVTTRVSVTTEGASADRRSLEPAISGDGRVVAFPSDATNLVASDPNGVTDVFVRDVLAGVTTRVAGPPIAGAAYEPALSADGRYVAFTAWALTNAYPGDTGGVWEVFVRDRQTGVTTRVSQPLGAAPPDAGSFQPGISADGRYVTFTSGAANLVAADTNDAEDVFVRDLQTGVTTRVSVATGGAQSDGPSVEAAISADGHTVAFRSDAANVVPGDTNGASDVFVRDLRTGVTTRVSVATSGAQADAWSSEPALSADGRYVAFSSGASTLVAGDTNAAPDVFVRDLRTGVTSRVSVAGDGTQGDAGSFAPSVSADGRTIAFWSAATTLDAGDRNGEEDVFVARRR